MGPGQTAASLSHHIGVDAPRFGLPAVGVLHPGHGQDKSKAIEALFQLAQLVEVGRVLGPVVGIEQRHGARPLGLRLAAQHADERGDADAAGDHHDGAVGIVVEAHRSRRTHDAHACAGVGGRERLFVGALAHAGGDRQPVLVRRGCEREGALAIVARAWKILRQK